MMNSNGRPFITILVSVLQVSAISSPVLGADLSVDNGRLKTEMRMQVERGCINAAKRATSNHIKYCSCFAKSFTDRYTLTQIQDINAEAQKYTADSKIISLLLSPEINQCKTKFPSSL